MKFLGTSCLIKFYNGVVFLLTFGEIHSDELKTYVTEVCDTYYSFEKKFIKNLISMHIYCEILSLISIIN